MERIYSRELNYLIFFLNQYIVQSMVRLVFKFQDTCNA